MKEADLSRESVRRRNMRMSRAVVAEYQSDATIFHIFKPDIYRLTVSSARLQQRWRPTTRGKIKKYAFSRRRSNWHSLKNLKVVMVGPGEV